MPETRPATILIVEDDPGIAQQQQRHLERAGYATRAAACGEEALAALKQHRIDLVLLDPRLPGTRTGLSFLEQLKASGADVPVIVVSGPSDEGSAISALRAGVRDFIPKQADYLNYLATA